jgi:hypothetical protein
VAEHARSHDQKSARKFFQFLFPIFVAGYIELRSIRPGGGAPQQEFFPVTNPMAAAERAIELREEADVYFGVAPRTEESGKAAAVPAVQVLWADIDTDAGRAGLARFPLSPSMVARSGSGENIHAYWPLDSPIDAGEAECLMRSLAEQIDSDKCVTDRARILRVPGTLNHKGDEPTPVTLERCAETRYSVGQLRDVLDIDAAKPNGQPANSSEGSDSKTIGADGASEPASRVLDLLEGVQGRAGSWTALCPAHDDTRPSLSISEGEDGRCLLKCHAGCETEAVVNGLGLVMSDLFTGSPVRRAASLLVERAERAGLELLHMGELPFAAMKVNGHLRTWSINSPAFARELRRIQYVHSREALGKTVLEEAIATLAARAIFEGEERKIFCRVAQINGSLVIDLGDDSGRVIKVTTDGWDLLRNDDVNFVREIDDLPFPTPVEGGSIDELQNLTNCADEANFKVFVGSILMCFHPTGPYPLIYITGEQGSAKSTHSRMVASLADPRKAPLSIGQPGTKDLVAGANGVRLLGFDNVSPLPQKFSDALCQLLTGGGHRARELFTDAGRFILEMRVAVQMNGIGNVIKRPDLQERTAVTRLNPIPSNRRRTEEEFLRAWKDAQPRIFGALLDGISAALANRSTVKLDGYPRMADFALWVEAAAPTFGWKAGEFVAALEGGQAELVDDTIDGHPELEALFHFISEHKSFYGTAQELLAELSQKVSDDQKGRYWPTQPDQLSKRLDEFAPLLRAREIEFVRERQGGGNRTRMIHIYRVGDAGTRRDAES